MEDINSYLTRKVFISVSFSITSYKQEMYLRRETEMKINSLKGQITLPVPLSDYVKNKT